MCFLCKNEPLIDHELVENMRKETPNPEQMTALQEILEQKWKEIPYSLEEVALFKASMDFIQFAPKKRIEEIFQEIGVIVTQKDRKKGRNGYAVRLMRTYHKSKVRQVFTNFLMFCRSANCRKEFEDIMNGTNVVTHIKQIIETFDGNVLYWFLSTLEQNREQVINTYRTECQKEYVWFLLESTLTYQHFDFPNVMTQPDKLKGTYESIDPRRIKHENKTLKVKMGKIKKGETQLKQENYQLHQQAKQLKGELHTLYEQSLLEIEQLKSEMERERRMFQKERDYLMQLLEERVHGKEETQRHFNPLDLTGKKICVIGGSRSRYYEEIVQKYNGEIHFVPADDFKKIKGAVSSSDSVFFLTELVSHKHFREAVTAAEESQKPFWYINSKGTSSFERHLQEFINTSVS